MKSCCSHHDDKIELTTGLEAFSSIYCSENLVVLLQEQGGRLTKFVGELKLFSNCTVDPIMLTVICYIGFIKNSTF